MNFRTALLNFFGLEFHSSLCMCGHSDKLHVYDGKGYCYKCDCYEYVNKQDYIENNKP